MSEVHDEGEDIAMNDGEWWVAIVGDTLVWARLNVLESGIAEIFDSSGERPRYDDEQHARMALLDAEFRAFDGLDEEDAAIMGFDLESVEAPRATDEEELLSLMVQKLARIQ
ncbi:MAG: hypothetical protein WAS23_04885 [Dokdonella sp.]|uniref:hypothetical protein n=1 Tax=Dokdonella sp. TaxID=2291710 RepID=UPI002B5FD1D4|nr:hypothetical protein [Dokdonella sp.]HOX72241.1 hypothetical protein [Dokdonella sp.]HPG94642.1 hypothetical protein [Dokdonella sp.]HPN79577.1 hypothetical protein [Dokdonella sp.]